MPFKKYTKRRKRCGGVKTPSRSKSKSRSPSQSAKLMSGAVLMDDYFEDLGPYTYTGRDNIESKKKWVEKIEEKEKSLIQEKERKESELTKIATDLRNYLEAKKRYEKRENEIRLSTNPRNIQSDLLPTQEQIDAYDRLFIDRRQIEAEYERYKRQFRGRIKKTRNKIKSLQDDIKEISDELQQIQSSIGPNGYITIRDAEIEFHKARKEMSRSRSRGGRREKTRKKKYACYIEPVHKLNRRTGAYTTNFKIIDGTRVYYTKHFDKNPNSRRILERYQRENPKKCMAFARMEDHILNQQDRAIKHLNKTGSCKVGDKISYKVTILSRKMREKLGDNYTHHETLIDDVMRCR